MLRRSDSGKQRVERRSSDRRHHFGTAVRAFRWRSKPLPQAVTNPERYRDTGSGSQSLGDLRSGQAALERGQDAAQFGAHEVGEACQRTGEYAAGESAETPLGPLSGLGAENFAMGAHPGRNFTRAEQNRQDIALERASSKRPRRSAGSASKRHPRTPR